MCLSRPRALPIIFRNSHLPDNRGTGVTRLTPPSPP
jgi:hypothetical protein